jgi:geranylgeranyl pyrophosphate synthase
MFDYGKSVGIAFQLMDDILDYTGTEKELGKPPRQDLREGKITLPLLHALREAGSAERGRAVELLARKKRSVGDIAFLARLVERTGGIEYTARTAGSYVARGKRYLSALPESNARAALLSLSDYIVSRSH